MVHRVHIGEMLLFVSLILVFDVIQVGIAAFRGDIQFRIQPFQFYTGGSHGQKGAGLIGRPCVDVYSVVKYFRIVPEHSLNQFAVLTRSLFGQFSVTPLGAVIKFCGNFQSLFPCRSQHLSLFCVP